MVIDRAPAVLVTATFMPANQAWVPVLKSQLRNAALLQSGVVVKVAVGVKVGVGLEAADKRRATPKKATNKRLGQLHFTFMQTG